MNKEQIFLKLRCFLLLSAFVVSSSLFAEDGIILQLKSGKEVGFMFMSKPKVIPGEELVITADCGTSVVFNYDEISRILFGDVATTGIERMQSSSSCEVMLSLFDGKLSIERLAIGESVSIFNLSGQMIATAKQTTDGSPLLIPLSARGIFVVCISTGVSCKIINK